MAGPGVQVAQEREPYQRSTCSSTTAVDAERSRVCFSTRPTVGCLMPETPFPSPEELQKKIQEFMKTNFCDKVSVSAFTQQAPTDEPPEEHHHAIDPFEFNATPKQIKAHLDRFVIQQD